MNYYEHHLADYTQATAHLSMLEDAAYSRMLRFYYANEKPLPGDIKQIERLVRAQTKPERDAVKNVLTEFFILHEGVYHQDRADKEIARYQDKQRKAAASANARWSKSTSHYDGNANALQTHYDGNAHQTPNTRHQTPDPNQNHKNTTHQDLNEGTVSKAGAVCVALRAEGIVSTNPSHPDLAGLLEAGAEIHDFVMAARIAKDKGKGFAYAIGIVKQQRMDAERIGKQTAKKGNIHEQRAETIATLTGRNKKPEYGTTIDGVADAVD